MTTTSKPILLLDPKCFFTTGLSELDKLYKHEKYQSPNSKGERNGTVYFYIPELWKIFSELFQTVYVTFKYNSVVPVSTIPFIDAIPDSYDNIKTLEDVPAVHTSAIELFRKTISESNSDSYVLISPFRSQIMKDFILEDRKAGLRNFGLFPGFAVGFNSVDLEKIRLFCEGVDPLQEPSKNISISSSKEIELLDDFNDFYGFGSF